MLIPVIKVKDKGLGDYVHIVGTNTHDSLVVYKDHLEYYNLQNGCGTAGNDEYGYEFVFEENEWDVPYIEFVTLEEFIKLSEKEIDDQTKGLIASYKCFTERHKKEVQEARNKAGIIMDTGGDILD